MFWIIETEEQLSNLSVDYREKTFIQPIYNHPNIHPAIGNPILVYLKQVSNRTGFLICINHSESLKIPSKIVINFLKEFKNVVTVDPKKLLYLSEELTSTRIYMGDIEPSYPSFFFNPKYSNFDKLNKIIPLSKHFEYWERFTSDLLYNEEKILDREEKYGMLEDMNLFKIEKQGLTVDMKIFPREKLNQEVFSLRNGKVYTRYNTKTKTGRPSNSFNGINFAAIPKDSILRESIIPEGDYFLELDFKAYHPTLICKIIDYIPEGEDLYEDFAKKLSKSREEIKKLIFKQMYGNISSEYTNLEFFQKLQNKLDEIWKEYNIKGSYTCQKTGKIFSKTLNQDITTSSKLFNYIIQNLETSMNMELMSVLHELLENRKSKIVLYTYDAFLIDCYKEDEKTLSHLCQTIRDRGINVHMKRGVDYRYLR